MTNISQLCSRQSQLARTYESDPFYGMDKAAVPQPNVCPSQAYYAAWVEGKIAFSEIPPRWQPAVRMMAYQGA